MGLYASVDVFSDLQFLSMTPVLGLIPDYSIGCAIFCAVFESVSKSLCPVDTGRLQQSLIADTDGMTYCEAITDCEYAQYQEYGTWCMPAQPYFEVAVETAINMAFDSWKQAEITVFEEEQEILQGFGKQFLSLASTAYSKANNNERMGDSQHNQWESCMRTAEGIQNQIRAISRQIASLVRSMNTGKNKGDRSATDAIHARIASLKEQQARLRERKAQVVERGFVHLQQAFKYYATASVYQIEGDINTAQAQQMDEAVAVSQQIQQYGGMFSPPATLVS